MTDPVAVQHTNVDFEAPPITEVVLGRTFLPRPDFLVPHFGSFWEKWRAQFPKVEHAQPIFSAAPFSEEGFILPRVWLISEDSTRLMQLQQDRFHFNWRQTDKQEQYVRFPVILKECMHAWSSFDEFVKQATGHGLSPTIGELTYINFLPAEEGVSATALMQEAMRDFKFAEGQRRLPMPSAVNLQTTYVVPELRGTFRVSAVSAKRKKPESDGLRLELTISGKCGGDDNFERWAQQAHDFLVAGFVDLTTPEMRAKWKQRG